VLEKRVHTIVRPERELLWMYILTSLLGFVAAPIVFVPLFFHYETLWYRFSPTGIAMGSGILFRSEQQLTYARMQDIHLSQNIIERWFGIGTVTVQTAGAGAGGNLRIVGVRDFNGIRDYLYAKMRGVRDESQGASTDALLTDIRDALRDAANALAKKEA
jgi:putative membrane protein